MTALQPAPATPDPADKPRERAARGRGPGRGTARRGSAGAILRRGASCSAVGLAVIAIAAPMWPDCVVTTIASGMAGPGHSGDAEVTSG